MMMGQSDEDYAEVSGYALRRPLPKDEIIHFCLEVAEEAMRQAKGKSEETKTIAEIADWFRGLVETPASE